MDFQTGKAVGSFAKFLHIPHLLLEEFCATLAVSWALQGSTKSKPNKEYDDFINGVFSTEGTPERSQVLTDDIVESVLTDEESYDENMSDTIEVSYATPPDEQDLIDIQLQRELASDLKRSNGVFEDSTTTSTTIHGQGASSHKYDMMIVDCAENIQQSRLERPRSSSLSPAPTDQSALDTFTAELLAKAEECSTIGSFGRGPSVSMRRETSEVQVVDRTRGEQDRQRGTRRLKGNVLQESPDVVELLSDDDNDRDDDDDDVQEMDFVILAARKIEA